MYTHAGRCYPHFFALVFYLLTLLTSYLFGIGLEACASVAVKCRNARPVESLVGYQACIDLTGVLQ